MDAPRASVSTIGPELTAEAFVEWCTARRIGIGYIQPGKPDQNAFIERFNRTYRTEVLDAHLFESLDQVRAITEEWLEIYNTERSHDSLGRVPPLTFLPRPDDQPRDFRTS
jgi:putative transposase